MARTKGSKNKTRSTFETVTPETTSTKAVLTQEKLDKAIQPDIQTQIVEVIKEVFITKEVEKPQLEGFELYKALKDSGFYQGGIGQFQEDMNGTEKVYLPHASEIYGQFAQDPEGWGIVRDYLARAFLALKDTNAR